MLQQGKHTLPVHLIVDYDDGVGVDLDQTAADVALIFIPFRCHVRFAGLTITETCAGTTPGVVKMDLRPTAGSDTARGDGDIANFAMATTAAGKLLYDLVAVGTILYPGQQVVVEIATQPVTGPAGHFYPHLVVEPADEVWANLANAVATA